MSRATEDRRASLPAIKAATEQPSWKFFCFRNTLTADELEQLLQEPELDGVLANEKKELQEEIADRRKFEQQARCTNWSFVAEFPHMAKLLESLPHQCAFLRHCDFCNTSHKYFADFTEGIQMFKRRLWR